MYWWLEASNRNRKGFRVFRPILADYLFSCSLSSLIRLAQERIKLNASGK
jgi:hypothetical protein